MNHVNHVRRKLLIKSYGYVIFGWPLLHTVGKAAAAEALLPFDANSLAALRKAHAGKPFVLAFWSVYCEPCRDEMAEWDAVKRKHPTLPIALVSTDAPSDRALIDDFFKKYPPGPVQKWLFADAFSERVRYSIDKSWRGELPKSYFFDAAHRAEVKSGKVDRVWIEAWLARQTPQSR
jgi:thiol-disulfide isomerase/thioredoxin